MRRLLIIIVCFIPLLLRGQDPYAVDDRALFDGLQQRVYLATQPFDFGIGVRYDVCPGHVGAYGSASYGNGYLYRLSGIQHHIKLTAGIMIDPYKKRDIYFLAGLNYHYADLFRAEEFVRGTPIDRPWSFELGVSRHIIGKIWIGLRTDILRWEPCVDIGIRL
jgi:hypothetical protein